MTGMSKRARRERKRRAAEAVPDSCVAYSARRILRDSETAIRGMAPPDAGEAAWRTAWFGAVALLRAVGHALQKEDAPRSRHLAEAIETAWKIWKTDRRCSQIFYGFIEDERNALLKEYRFHNERKMGAAGGNRRMHLVVIEGRAVSPTDALQIALGWWRTEIGRIERDAAGFRKLNIHKPARSLGGAG
jgi:hypothetical protein